MLKQWTALAKYMRKYWRAYGGIRAVVGSPFFAIAMVLALLNYSQWITPTWPQRVESLIPSLLGFSLGTYAILFSIMSHRMKGALRSVKISEKSGTNWLESINATFFHFIFVQVLTLLWAIAFQGTWMKDIFGFIETYDQRIIYLYESFAFAASLTGAFLMNYSLLLMVAAAMAIYRLALIRDPLEDEDR